MYAYVGMCEIGYEKKVNRKILSYQYQDNKQILICIFIFPIDSFPHILLSSHILISPYILISPISSFSPISYFLSYPHFLSYRHFPPYPHFLPYTGAHNSFGHLFVPAASIGGTQTSFFAHQCLNYST